MPFRCPDCKTATMVPVTLDTNLSSDECSTCHGHWITAARYFSYSASQESTPGPAASTDTEIEPLADTRAAKFCPTCAKFMHYYPVGHGLAFGIDKCNTCGGVWLNAGEWDSLKRRQLHLQLHAISSDIWQADLAAQRRTESERNILLKLIGHADLAEAERIKIWLAVHPHRSALLAYIQNAADHSPVSA